MEELKSQVVANILEVLTDATKEDAENAVNHLVDDLRLRNLGELHLVAEGDLADFLGVIQARRLLQVWKDKAAAADGNGSERERNERRQLLAIENPNQVLEPHNEFKIDWEDLYKIDANIKVRLRSGKKLRTKQKKEVVKRIVNQVRAKAPHAKRDIFKTIVKRMKTKYTLSFHSELAGGKMARGSLCRSMQIKFDNDKRPETRKTRVEREAPGIKPAYGCKKWRLASLPQGENQESLNQIQEELVHYFEITRVPAWDWEYIDDRMEKTYGLLREDINKQAEQLLEMARKAQKESRKKNKDKTNRAEEEEIDDINLLTTEQIRDKWPFLFQPRCMIQHFNRLTETKLEEETENFLKKDIENIIQFLVSTNKGKPKKIKKKMNRAKEQLPPNNAEMIALLSLLMQRFGETEESLWIVIDPAAREEDIPTQCQIPKTPRLIIAGESIFKPTTIFLSMDKQMLGTADTLLEGIQLLFAAYYVFNLEYEAEAQVTLEFFQRCVVNMNPPQGNKRPKKGAGGHSSSYKVHHQLTKFNKQYDDYRGDQEDVTSPEEEN